MIQKKKKEREKEGLSLKLLGRQHWITKIKTLRNDVEMSAEFNFPSKDGIRGFPSISF
jgi:hypothetical protein